MNKPSDVYKDIILDTSRECTTTEFEELMKKYTAMRIDELKKTIENLKSDSKE